MFDSYIVLTRPVEQSYVLQTEIEKLGYHVFFFPTIAITKNKSNKEYIKYLQNVASFDWIIFTSQNGVTYFIQALKELQINYSLLERKQIGAVGSKTAEEIRKYNLPIHFIPSKFTTLAIANEIQHIHGKKILLPRASIATLDLAKKLEEKGAFVTNISIYTTELVENKTDVLETLLQTDKIAYLTFTSPSTVKGFIKNIQMIKRKEAIFSLPVISIGPVTTRELKEQGFRTIETANPFTAEGIVSKIKENIL